MGPLWWTGVAWMVGLTVAQPGMFAALVGLLLATFGLGELVLGGRWGHVLAAAGLAMMLVGTTSAGPEWTGPVQLRGVVVSASSGRWADLEVAGGGRLRARFPERAPRVGSAVVLAGEASPLRPRTRLPGAPNEAAWGQRAGVRTEVRVRVWRRIGGEVKERSSREGLRHGGLLRALATGDRSEVPEAEVALLRRTGVAHLLAVSGFHVGLVALLVGGLTRVALRPLVLLRPSGWPEEGAMALAAVLGAASFAWYAGGPVSAQRAVLVAGMVALARSLGRSVLALDLLGAAAMVVTLWDPAAPGSAGFQLSFCAVVGMVRLGPWLMRWLPAELPAPLRWLLQGASASAGATLGTLPVVAWWFQALPVGTLPANLVAMPVVSVGLAPCALLALWGPEPLAGWAALAGDHVAEGLLDVLGLLDAQPLAPALAGGGVLLGILVLVAPRPWVAAALALVAVGLTSGRDLPSGLRVTFLDVGQGDAALVEFPDGRRWLIDGGPPGDAVLHWLRREGLRHLDVVACSHAQDDHAGGLLPVLGALDVGELWLGSAEGAHDLLQVARERGVPVRLRPDGSLQSDASDDINDRSLVLVAEYGGRRALFTGDVEREAEGALRGLVPRADLLKVAHHGSRTSSTRAFVEEVRPALAVVSVGAGNRFGHPHRSVTSRFAELGIPLRRTDVEGTVEVELGAHTARVRSYRPATGWSPSREVLLSPLSSDPCERRYRWSLACYASLSRRSP